MSLVSTVSGGRAHIASGSHYVGSVNSYNHWFTKLVAKILGLSMKVGINGKERQVNIKSYQKLLVKSGHAESEKASDHQYFSANLLSGESIRKHISRSKRYALSNKLAEAIFNKDEERAIKLINKGAKLNHQYSQIGNHAYTFLPLQNFFNPDRSHKITVTTGTHWIHANQKGLGRVKQALVRAGADTMGQGKKYQYVQRIEAIRRRTKLGISPAIGIGFSGPFCGLALGLKKTAEPVISRSKENIEYLRYSA